MFYSFPGERLSFVWRNSVDTWTGLIRSGAVSEPIGRTGKVGRSIRNNGPDKGHWNGKVQLSCINCFYIYTLHTF